jgi:hypothetical protein
VTARLEPLGDDRIAAPRRQQSRFVRSRRISQYSRPRGENALHELLVGQAEMEADQLRPDLFDQGAHRFVERPARRRAAGRGLERFPSVIRSEEFPPFPVVGRFRGAVAEEIEVDRAAGLSPNLGDLGADFVWREHSAGQGPDRAATDCGDRQLDPGGAGHRRGDDRQAAAEQLGKTAVGPAAHQ